MKVEHFFAIVEVKLHLPTAREGNGIRGVCRSLPTGVFAFRGSISNRGLPQGKSALGRGEGGVVCFQGVCLQWGLLPGVLPLGYRPPVHRDLPAVARGVGVGPATRGLTQRGVLPPRKTP